MYFLVEKVARVCPPRASEVALQPDRLHFDAQGAELLGRRVYERLVQVVGKIR